MSWTSSPKDSVLGLAVLQYFGISLVVTIAVAGLSALGGAPYAIVPGWLIVGIAGFCFGAYVTAYSCYGLYLRLVAAHRRRNGPALSARLETGALVLVWAALASGLTALAPGSMVLVGLACAAVSSMAGGVLRSWATRSGIDASR